MQITSSWYICHYKHRIVRRAIIYLHLGHDLQFIYKKEKEGDLTRSPAGERRGGKRRHVASPRENDTSFENPRKCIFIRRLGQPDKARWECTSCHISPGTPLFTRTRDRASSIQERRDANPGARTFSFGMPFL